MKLERAVAGGKSRWGCAILTGVLLGCEQQAQTAFGPADPSPSTPPAATGSPPQVAAPSATRNGRAGSRSGRAEKNGPADSSAASERRSSAVRSPDCPAGMVRVKEFCIDRYEAHLVRLLPAAKETVHPHYQRPEAGIRYAARTAAGIAPQAYIARPEAKAACVEAGKRLCTLAEWYLACSGPKRLTYPYGNQSQSGACNTGKPHLLGKLFGNDPRRWSYADHFNNPRLSQEPGFLSLTGQYARCVSHYGVHDLVGNLHEWVSDRVDYSLPRKIALQADILAKITVNYGHGIFMGGFYSTTEEHGPGCRFVTIGHGPRYHDYSTGFRCCWSPSTKPQAP